MSPYRRRAARRFTSASGVLLELEQREFHLAEPSAVFARHVLFFGDREELRIERQALHSHRIAWHSPATRERREVTSALPGELRALLDEG